VFDEMLTRVDLRDIIQRGFPILNPSWLCQSFVVSGSDFSTDSQTLHLIRER